MALTTMENQIGTILPLVAWFVCLGHSFSQTREQLYFHPVSSIWLLEDLTYIIAAKVIFPHGLNVGVDLTHSGEFRAFRTIRRQLWMAGISSMVFKAARVLIRGLP
ncbi:uncharacterized protein N7500_001315 [Penicillium coprophilum]|uniref:uncharacterized protein n=1 Tax=Penicillium coprophilum TaxID=36646 RepID=UPI0023849B9F|nr:uncharacterized protein N7500_001315 [Penicillium coprophilum]KAJ5178616.1 hypothetical protein N7500_001315 [Penicillium coprophilum]